MKPVDFVESNTHFGPPSEMTEGQVQTVPAYIGQAKSGSCDGMPMVVVAWEPSKEDLELLSKGEPIYLTIMGSLPPHYLSMSFTDATNPA